MFLTESPQSNGMNNNDFLMNHMTSNLLRTDATPILVLVPHTHDFCSPIPQKLGTLEGHVFLEARSFPAECRESDVLSHAAVPRIEIPRI